MGLVPSPEDAALIQQKQQQALGYLRDNDIDAWLVFVREGSEPILTSLIAGPSYIVQNAAFIFTRDGRRIALLEPIDIQNGAGTYFDEVIEFRFDVGHPLRQVWARLDPRRVALNYSATEFAADGLTLGMYRRLLDALGELGLEQRMVSAENLIVAIRAVKTEEERDRLKTAAEITIELAREMSAALKPGITDSDLADLVRERATAHGASGASASLAVNGVGKNVKGPLGKVIEPGQTIVSDMGAVYKGYKADIKRLWYVAAGDEPIPEVLRRQWDACQASLAGALKALRPGRPGYEVHEEAWVYVEECGFPRDNHSYGHQIGREAHDAGPWLGERANPYRPAEGRLEAGMVVTLDPTINRVGISRPDAFCMGCEEMAEVTEGGGRLLHEPQDELWVARF